MDGITTMTDDPNMPVEPSDETFVGYRRRVEIVPSPGGVRAGLEDDFHRFTLALALEGDWVRDVEGTVERTPWTVCPGALANLVAKVRGRSFEDVQAIAAKGDQCTHLVELAGLATAHAHEPRPTRFDITVSDPVDDRRQARVHRDDELILDWTLEGTTICSPESLAGLDVGGLSRWIARLPEAGHEAVYLLARGIHNAGARRIAVGAAVDPQTHRTRRAGACYAYGAERLQDTARQPRLEFSSRPEGLLQGWLPS